MRKQRFMTQLRLSLEPAKTGVTQGNSQLKEPSIAFPRAMRPPVGDRLLHLGLIKGLPGV